MKRTNASKIAQTSIIPDLVRAKLAREIEDYYNRVPSYWEQLLIVLLSAALGILIAGGILGLFI